MTGEPPDEPPPEAAVPGAAPVEIEPGAADPGQVHLLVAEAPAVDPELAAAHVRSETMPEAPPSPLPEQVLLHDSAAQDMPAEEPEPPDLWDRCARWLSQRGALPALGLLTIVMSFIYAHAFRGELAGDDLTFHMAESARLTDCLRAGDFDFWNPSANAGFASAYYYQVIPQLASAIPAALLGHHLFFFELSVVLPLVLAPAAAYRGMRLLGATPWQAVIAALVIGFLNGESRWGTGNAGTFNVGLYTQTWALTAFPLALGHAVRWATESKSLAPAVAWGAFVTLCHPFAGVSLAIALVAGWLAQLGLAATDRLFAMIGERLTGDPDRGAISAAKAALGQRWRNPPPRPWLGELLRLAILAACFVVTWTPIWLPLVIDYAGFGGFPHRVSDEVGPGFATLLKWYAYGSIFDYARPTVLTWSLPLILLLARARFLRWLLAPAVVYAVWLGLGPHLGKTDDDLIPAVRFLGAMQVVLGLAIGAGAVWLGKQLWDAPEGSALHRPIRAVMAAVTPAKHKDWARDVPLQDSVRTGVAAIAAALGVLLVLPGARALASRVRVMSDSEANHGHELHEIAERLQREPPGRKQVGPGAESHWWNLLTYEYGRRPSLLMMGGGGLQASPNYDSLWTVKDFAKNAWLYDAPILVFEKDKGSTSSIPPGDDIFATKNYQVRRLKAPGLVSPVQITGKLPSGRKAAHAAAIEWLKGDLPRKDHVLVYDGFGEPGGEPHGTVTRALRQDSPGDAADIYAEVDVTEKTTFMARESWHPRWHAYVDLIEVPVRRVTPDFPAVDVVPGHHVIAFRFERPWWMHAAWLAWPLVPLLAWLVMRLGRPRRPRRQLARASLVER